MTPTWDLVGGAFVAGFTIPVLLYTVYWFAVDTMKRHVAKEIRGSR